jgi:hypothetical protein
MTKEHKKQNERMCGECGKPYTLTEEQLKLVKKGWYILLYVCPDCVRRANEELKRQ